MTLQGKRWLVGITWLAAALRFHALFANRFHADEALFASWARLIAVGRDLLLQGQLVDKPPLQFYLQAFFYPLMGPVEWAARLPALAASLLLVPAAGLLAWRLFGHELEAVASAALVALSPLAIQFSATAFTDPLLTLLLVLSLYHALAPTARPAHAARIGDRSCMWSGLFFALAAATKHQAWLFLPLFWAIGLYAGWNKRQWRRWLVPLLVGFSTVLLWQLARSSTTNIWLNQLSNYGGIRPAWSWELKPRLLGWLSLWGRTVALPVLLLAFPFSYLLARPESPGRAGAGIFCLYLLGYFWIHWLLAIPVWDRYVLPVVPLVALLLSRSLGLLIRRAPSRFSSFLRWRDQIGPERQRGTGIFPRESRLVALLILLQLPLALDARAGRFAIGGLPTADQGAAAVAQLLADAPYGTVLYDHWYSWHWRYHLFDKRIYVSWFPHPDALAEDLNAFGRDGNQRFIALPKGDRSRPVKRAVTGAGFRLQAVPIDAPGQIDLFLIIPSGVPS